MEPLKDGKSTSEHAMAKATQVAGDVVALAGITMAAMEQAGFKFGWMPVAMVVLGVLARVASMLGYTRSRTVQKMAVLEGQAAEVLKVSVPFAQAVAKAVREQESSSRPTPPERPLALPVQP